MLAALRRGSSSLALVSCLVVAGSALFAAHGAAAQAANGSVTGRVLWGPCLRALPDSSMPPDAQSATPAPGAPSVQVGPGMQPLPSNGLPAGAVLVALQNTSISARTDEAGHFTLSDVPVGQYFTLAAGPVANSNTAVAERPNVLVAGGQSLDVGTLSLGSQLSALSCRGFPGPASGAATDTQPADVPPPGN